MKLLKSKKLMLVLSIFLVSLITITLGIDLTFNKPTKLNKIVAAKRYKSSGTPANTAFKDQNFYNCVVDAYNDKNGTSVAYTDVLGDEQLKTITSLSCSNSDKSNEEKINNVEGIENLINLRGLYLNGNLIETINLESLSQLVTLVIDKNQLQELDLSYNNNLDLLSATYNQLSNIKINYNNRLRDVSIDHNQLTRFEGYNLPELDRIHISNNNLTTLTFNNPNKLREIVANNNLLANVDFTNVPNLKSLTLSQNQLTSVNLTSNSNLVSLYLNDNLLTSLNLTKNTILSTLNVERNQLNNLDLTNNSSLQYLRLGEIQPTIYDSIYINDIYYFRDYSNNVKLPSSKSLTFDSISSYSPGITIDNEKQSIIATTKGPKSARLYYEHDIQTYQNQLTYEHYFYVIQATSTKYEINEEEGYIYTGFVTEQETILNNITLNYGEAKIENNKLIIEHENKTVKEFDIVNISNSKYDLTKDYIYVENEEFDKNEIIVTNGEVVYENNKVTLKYNDKILKTYYLILVNSGTYNLNDDYIYVENEEFDKNKISITNGEVVYENNKVTLKYNDKILKTYDIVTVNSDTYDLDKNYIYIGTKEFDLSKITITNGTTSIEDNKLVIKYDGKTIKTIDIVSINSKTYNLEKDYIYVGAKDLDLTKITVTNGVSKEENDVLKITYEEAVLKEYPILKINSDVYEIGENYIHTKDSGIIHDKIIRTHNMTLNLRGFAVNDKYEHEYVLRYNGEEITTFKLVSYSSDSYDLEKDYIYIGSNELKLDEIETNNADISVKNNLLEISFENNILRQIKIVSISSEEYNLNKDYINAGTKPLDKTKITITHGEILEEDNKIKITYDNEVLQTFNIVKYSLGNLRINGKNIIVGNTVTYEDLKDNIRGNITYKVYNNDEEVNEIGENYKLYVYYNDEKVDEYTFTTEYLTFNEELESKIDKDNNYILGNEIGTKVSDIKSLIDTSGSISFVDKDNKELTDDSKIGTGSKVKITLSTGDVYYELVVTGDTSGDGRLTVSDLVKINNHIISEDKKLTGVYKLASDYDGNGRITVSDIVKINNKILGGN